MPEQTIVIRQGSFVCTLYAVENLMALPLANVRKLWKIMFSDPCENKNTIQLISNWLPQTVTCSEAAMAEENTRLWQVTQYANALRSKVTAFGSMATKEQKAELKKAITVLRYAEKRAKDTKARHERAKKLLTIWGNFSNN